MTLLPEREVRDGAKILRFRAEVLAAATSQRPGIPRWTELAVYRTTAGSLILSKVGRTEVAHRPECCKARPDIWPTWTEAGAEGKIRRVPCLECQPLVGNQMDPMTLLETQRYVVLQARDFTDLEEVLTQGRDHLPAIIRKVIDQLRLRAQV